MTARIGQAEVDLIAAPISVAEEEFLMLALNHFHAGWLLVKEGGLVSLEVLAADARAFVTLPIPRAVWERTKHARDPKFVQFIENALAEPTRRSSLLSKLLK